MRKPLISERSRARSVPQHPPGEKISALAFGSVSAISCTTGSDVPRPAPGHSAAPGVQPARLPRRSSSEYHAGIRRIASRSAGPESPGSAWDRARIWVARPAGTASRAAPRAAVWSAPRRRGVPAMCAIAPIRSRDRPRRGRVERRAGARTTSRSVRDRGEQAAELSKAANRSQRHPETAAGAVRRPHGAHLGLEACVRPRHGPPAVSRRGPGNGKRPGSLVRRTRTGGFWLD